MILREWDPSQTLDEVDFSTVEFWVQIHGLPLEITDEANARLIRGMPGVILELDDVDTDQSIVRLKIRFPTSKPLDPRFIYFWEDRRSVWIGFKYERLSSFCFHCGLIDHTIGACYQNPPHPLNYALTDSMRCNSAMIHSGVLSREGVQSPIIWEVRQQPVLNRSSLVAVSTEVPSGESFHTRVLAGNPKALGVHETLESFASEGKSAGSRYRDDSMQDLRGVVSGYGDSVNLGSVDGSMYSKNTALPWVSKYPANMGSFQPIHDTTSSLDELSLGQDGSFGLKVGMKPGLGSSQVPHSGVENGRGLRDGCG